MYSASRKRLLISRQRLDESRWGHPAQKVGSRTGSEAVSASPVESMVWISWSSTPAPAGTEN